MRKGDQTRQEIIRKAALSIRSSNSPRALIPGRAPLLDLTIARMAAVIAASSGSSGCIAINPSMCGRWSILAWSIPLLT
jgi:hypothetical protein